LWAIRNFLLPLWGFFPYGPPHSHYAIELSLIPVIPLDTCEHCGSRARNEYGFCEECGARWRLVAAPSSATTAAQSHAPSPFAKLPAAMNSIDLVEVQPKQVWLAVLLALSLGPVGLYYCSLPGMIIMLIVSIALRLWLGDFSFLIILPICGVWAWRAARDSSSGFD